MLSTHSLAGEGRTYLTDSAMPKRDDDDSRDDDVVEPSLEDVDDFSEPEEEGEEQRGISLADLGKSFAKLLGRGTKAPPTDEVPAKINDDGTLCDASMSDGDEDFVVTPNSILEAMLFVGHPDNEPLTSRQLASLMRGVSPKEVDQLVVELNEQYAKNEFPYEIVAESDGYQMRLRDDMACVRERFYGRLREARLSQPAIDVLAVVAYHQPATRHQVDAICQCPTGAVLSLLVRRQLLRIEQTKEKPRKKLFHTTNRFLQLFRIESLEDLPRPQDTDDA